jgi:clan AA aspartic protease
MLGQTGEKAMGKVFAEITVKNNGDLVRVQDGVIQERDVRSVTVTAIVDTGAMTLVISEEMRQRLGLAVEETRVANLAGGSKMGCGITEPVRILWKNRSTACRAMVLPGGETLLGLIPLEEMDLIVDPVAEELAGAHGDEISAFVM